MIFLIFCLGSVLGSCLTLLIVLYWQSLVERIWLPPEKRHEPAQLIELDVLDADNPKIWLGCLLQFLFAELKDTEKVQKWFREKLIIEVEELKEKLPSRFVKDIKLNKFGLGTQPPIISNVKLSGWKTNQSKDVVEEVAVRCDLRYAGEFYVSLNVSLPVGQDAFVFIRLRQLIGNIEIKFSRQPFTHWSATFTDEPQTVIDAVTQVHGRAVPQLANIIVAKIKRTIRRRHVLPNFKIRFPPFFPRPAEQGAASPTSLLAQQQHAESRSPHQHMALNVHMVSYSRLPPSVENGAMLFFTLTCDSVPLTKQFSHVESFFVNISDANEAIGILFISTIYTIDAIDLVTRKFSVYQGYYISAIVADSPAQRAGIRPGGILVGVEGINIGSTSTNGETLLRRAAMNCRNGTVRLDICNTETPLCQLVPFVDSNSSALASSKGPTFGSVQSFEKSATPLVEHKEIGIDESALEVDEFTTDTSIPTTSSPNATLRHRKNLSNCSASVTSSVAISDLNSTAPVHSRPPKQLEESAISRSSSDTNLAFHMDNYPRKKVSDSIDIRPSSSYLSTRMPTANLSTTPKDFTYLAERPFQQAATQPPTKENCVILRYNDMMPVDESTPSDEVDDMIVSDVVWTKPVGYPSNKGHSASVNETFTLNLPITALSQLGTMSREETLKSVCQKGSFLNVVAWIGVPSSSSFSSSKAASKRSSDSKVKWDRLHAISHGVFELTAVVDELSTASKLSNSPCYVKRTANFFPFAPIRAIITENNGMTDDPNNAMHLSTQRGFAPELCFGDISIGFTLAVEGQQKHLPSQPPPFPLYRQATSDKMLSSSSARLESLCQSRTSSTVTLRGISEKLKTMRENCEHDLVVAVSSRSQPCTVCSKSLGILQRLSRSHAPLTCLRCGLLCHPRCAPINKLKPGVQPASAAKVGNRTMPSSDSVDSLAVPPSNFSGKKSGSSESLASSSSQANGGVMSKLRTGAKKIYAVAREKEGKIVAKAGPRLQKWRNLKGNRSITPVESNTSLTSLTLDDASEGIEIGEDVDSLLISGNNDTGDMDSVVAEELIRAWAAKAAESPGAALEGSLAEALLVNGESDSLLFQLKNLGKELFADLDSEERRQRLDSIITRLTEQLDEESERHAELKTLVKVARSEEAVANSHQGGLVRKFKQSGNGENVGPSALSLEMQLQRCDQRIKSLCLLIVHYSAGLDDCVSAAVRLSQISGDAYTFENPPDFDSTTNKANNNNIPQQSSINISITNDNGEEDGDNDDDDDRGYRTTRDAFEPNTNGL